MGSLLNSTRWFNRLADVAAAALSFVGLSDYFLRAPLQAVKKSQPLHLLFICQGNICRSPYANAALQSELLRQKIDRPVTVSSAGLETAAGKPADPTAVRIAKLRGFDLSSRGAEPISNELVHKADIVFVMEPTQRCKLQQLFPEAKEKVVILGALSLTPGKRLTIPDPYGKEDAAFHAAFDRIDLSLKTLVDHLR